MDPDLELLERWRAGDQRAGQDLFARHFKEIFRFFQHKVHSDADDLAQETFKKCAGARDQFRSQASFRTYLFAIARNELYRWLRNKRPRGERVDLEVSSLNELVSSPSKQLGREQEADRIRSAIRQLPVEQQVLLELHYWHDLDAIALAELLEVSPGAIRVRLSRARATLRSRLAGIAINAATTDPLERSLNEPELGPGDDNV